jgi:hypothetical protein
MKHSIMLTIASLLSLIFLLFHLADDFVRGISPVGPWTLIVVPVAAVLLYGTLVLTERRSGYLITLIVGIAAVGMPVLHLKGAGPSFNITKPGTFFFLFTLLALGVLGSFGIILSMRGLWSPQWGQSRAPKVEDPKKS